MSILQTIAEFKSRVKSTITLKTAPNSVSNEEVGKRFAELADLVAMGDGEPVQLVLADDSENILILQ